jgi:hypothetical protein
MKTRSGLVILPEGWPTLHEVRRNLPTVQTRDELLKEMQKIIKMCQRLNNLDLSRMGFLKASEMILRYHHFLTESEVQKLVTCVVIKLTHLKEYTEQFRALSNQYAKQRADRMTCAVLYLKDRIGVDCARTVAGLV